VSKDRVQLYKRMLREVAKELGEALSADFVKHVATMRMLRENMQIRLLAGERVDPKDIITIDEALKHYLPQGRPHTLEIQIVGRGETIAALERGVPEGGTEPPVSPTAPTEAPAGDVAKPGAEPPETLPAAAAEPAKPTLKNADGVW